MCSVCRLGDVVHLYIRKPERPGHGALDDAAAEPAREGQRFIGAVRGFDALGPPAEEGGVERARRSEVAGVKLEVDDGFGRNLHVPW